MSDEEMRRKMEFIVETLANVTTKIDSLVEAQASDSAARKKDPARIARLEASFVMLTELARSADERADRTERRVAGLEESLSILTELARSADERADRTEYRVAGLEEAYVNIAKMVERIEGEQHSGNSL